MSPVPARGPAPSIRGGSRPSSESRCPGVTVTHWQAQLPPGGPGGPGLSPGSGACRGDSDNLNTVTVTRRRGRRARATEQAAITYDARSSLKLVKWHEQFGPSVTVAVIFKHGEVPVRPEAESSGSGADGRWRRERMTRIIAKRSLLDIHWKC